MNAPPPQQYLTIFLGLCALALLTPTVGFAATPSDGVVDEVCVSLFGDARNYLMAGELEQARLQLSVAIEEDCEGDGDSEVLPSPDVADDELVFESDSCRQFYRRAEGHIADGDARSARDAVQSMDRLRCTWTSAAKPLPEEVDRPSERDPVVEPAESEIEETEEMGEETEDGREGRAEEIRVALDFTVAPTTDIGAVGGLVTIEYYLEDYLAVTGRSGWLHGISGLPPGTTGSVAPNEFGPYYRTSFLPVHGGIKYYVAETYKVFGFAEVGWTFIHGSSGMYATCEDEERMDYGECMEASKVPTERDTSGKPSAFAGLGFELRSAGTLSRILPMIQTSQISGGIYIPSIGDMADFQAGAIQLGISF